MVVFALLALQAAQEQDPRAKAVREAYEEQLRRDRPMLTLRIRMPVDAVSAPEGFDTLDRAGVIALLGLWIEGVKAYPDLIQLLDDRNLDHARSAARVLNLLTGRRAPLPDAETQERVKRDWEAWLRDPVPACAHVDGDVLSLIRDLGAEEFDIRRDAERALSPCASRHAALLKDAHGDAKDVEIRARLGDLIAASDRSALRPADLQILEAAHTRLWLNGDGGELLRAERERFFGRHRATLDVVLAALQK